MGESCEKMWRLCSTVALQRSRLAVLSLVTPGMVKMISPLGALPCPQLNTGAGCPLNETRCDQALSEVRYYSIKTTCGHHKSSFLSLISVLTFEKPQKSNRFSIVQGLILGVNLLTQEANDRRKAIVVMSARNPKASKKVIPKIQDEHIQTSG